MKRIAVWVDGSDGSGAAVGWAAAVASATGSELVALHAQAPAGGPGTAGRFEGQAAGPDGTLPAAWTEAARSVGLDVVSLVERGAAEQVLFAASARVGADLVVVGRTGHRWAPGLLHLGSLAEHAVHHTTQPLAVIPAGWTARPQRIVVGVDESAAALRALRWATDLAVPLGAVIVATEVEDPILEWTAVSSADNWRRDTERRLSEATQPALARGVEVVVRPERNVRAADGLLACVAADQADLLVIGTRAVSGVSGIRAGGVTLKLLHRAQLPLLIVPLTSPA